MPSILKYACGGEFGTDQAPDKPIKRGPRIEIRTGPKRDVEEVRVIYYKIEKNMQKNRPRTLNF